MVFRDECEIDVAAGKGGDGLVSFRREKYVPRGGPDGGDGGDGGDVVLEARTELSSLLTVARRPRYRADDGRPGGPRNRTGRSADALVIGVPPGTQVYDAERGNLLADLLEPGTRVVIAAGGRGGRGNARFATATNQAPRRADPGGRGEARRVRLELKLFAEVGLVGLPNAGKSTFLATVSRATPKIADYPFTTLSPYVGIAELPGHRTLVIADLPGLIEGAAEGQGLGHRFLKHVERCRVLLHLVDVSGGDAEAALEAVRGIDDELARYSLELAERPRLYAATKVESDEAQAAARTLAEGHPGRWFAISSHTGQGLDAVLEAAATLVAADEAEPTTDEVR